MAVSAVAARLAAVAQQQKAEQAVEISPTPSSSVYASPSSPINHPQRCHEDIQSVNEKQSRYFEAQSVDQNIPQNVGPNDNAHTSRLTPQKNFKRRRDSLRSCSIDPQCVSSWEPIYEGPNQNIVKLLDSNNNQSISWTLGLRTGQTLIAHGTFQLSILRGAVDLMGSEQRASSSEPIEIFAPPSHPLPIITAKDTQSDGSAIQVPHLDPSKFSTIIQLRDNHCGIHQLDELWTSNGGKSPIWTRSSRDHPVEGQTWSLLLSAMPNFAHLQAPPSWSACLSSLPAAEENYVYMVEGPKAAGKSTFSTLLINSLLNTFASVALLDLDPGQPLLTPPTLLSIHILRSPILGPSFCRLVSPHHLDSHSIYIGHTTPKDCPNRYVQASLELFNVYLNLQPDPNGCVSKNRRRRLRETMVSKNAIDSKRTDHIPLVINTMGWTRGVGQELLNQICESVQPNKIFSFSDQAVITNVSDAAERHIRLEPIGSTPLSLRLTPADCRILTIASYMHSGSGSGCNFFINQWDFQHPLWTRRPYEVRPERLSLPDHPEFDRSHLGYVLNGGLIGFINSSLGWWIGFGLVRAIDPTRKTIHLLTPAYPTSDQNQIEIEFVKYSEPEVPVICCISDGPVPYLEKEILGGPPTGSSGISNNLAFKLGKKRVRRNVQRRSQILR